MKYGIFAMIVCCCLGAGYQATYSHDSNKRSLMQIEQEDNKIEKPQLVQSWNHFPKS